MATLLICLIFGAPKMSHQSVFKTFKKKNLFFPTLESAATGRAGFVGGQSVQSQRTPYTEGTQAQFSTLMSPS